LAHGRSIISPNRTTIRAEIGVPAFRDGGIRNAPGARILCALAVILALASIAPPRPAGGQENRFTPAAPHDISHDVPPCACHTITGPREPGATPPNGVGRFVLEQDDLAARCGTCHKTRCAHPSDVAPASGNPGLLLGKAGAAAGKVICTTCHRVCRTARRDEEGALLRGGTYRDREEVCFLCHNAKGYLGFSPRRQMENNETTSLRKPARSAACLGLAIFLFARPCFSGERIVGNFGAGDLSGWIPKVFKGETSYSFVTEDGRTALKAHSRAAASGLFKEVDLDTRAYPVLRWSWKIEQTIKKGNERTKAGDDYAARVYVVFPKTLFWKTRAINYIWANALAAGNSVPSAYTSRSVLVAVESGDAKAGHWVYEERNVYEDYRKHFGEEPPLLGAVALMTDTDNTGEEATAWYGDIILSSEEASR
jgi:hypothetical protein